MVSPEQEHYRRTIVLEAKCCFSDDVTFAAALQRLDVKGSAEGTAFADCDMSTEHIDKAFGKLELEPPVDPAVPLTLDETKVQHILEKAL